MLALHQLYKSSSQERPSLSTLKAAVLALRAEQRCLISSACRLLQLLLIPPAMNPTFKRSFSALQRIKDYLQSTMTQGRLNHLMVLHYHQAWMDELDLKAICNEFIDRNATRRSTFAKFRASFCCMKDLTVTPSQYVAYNVCRECQ